MPGPRQKHQYQITSKNTGGTEISPIAGESVEDTEKRLLKRIITQALPWMGDWIRDNLDEMSQKTYFEVLKNKDTFNDVDSQSWKNLFERWTQREIEVQIWNRPIELKELLLKPSSNPLLSRVEELHQQGLEETLVFGWNHLGGLLAATGEEPSKKRLPELRTYLHTKTQENQDCWIWAWDKRNFIPTNDQENGI